VTWYLYRCRWPVPGPEDNERNKADTDAGGGIQASGTLQFLNIGEKLTIVGLFAQIVFFGIFIVVATIFQSASAATAPPKRLHEQPSGADTYTPSIGDLASSCSGPSSVWSST